MKNSEEGKYNADNKASRGKSAHCHKDPKSGEEI
jgi:hypothetical protein